MSVNPCFIGANSAELSWASDRDKQCCEGNSDRGAVPVHCTMLAPVFDFTIQLCLAKPGIINIHYSDIQKSYTKNSLPSLYLIYLI